MSTTEATREAVAARLTAIENENMRLRGELAALKRERAQGDRPRAAQEQAPQAPAVSASHERTSRRGMQRAVLGVTAATVAAGTLLETQRGTAQAAAGLYGTQDGDGNVGVQGNGTNGAEGVYGQSDTYRGVQGVSTSGTGVYGSSASATGVLGSSASANGVIGLSGTDSWYYAPVGVYGGITSSTAWAIVGKNDGGGHGVLGDATHNGNGAGTGVKGISDSGNGVYAQSGGGDAIHAVGGGGSKSGLFAEGGSGYGVAATSTGGSGRAAVYGIATNGTIGVHGQSDTGYGVCARGGLAPLYLAPAGTAGAPTGGSHQRGELYADSAGALFYCTASGTPGTWKQVTLT